MFGLINMKMLILSGNFLVHIKKVTFYKSNIDLIVTDNYHVCCITIEVKNLICTSRPSWPSTCDRLLENEILQIVIWPISISVLVFNIFSVALAFRDTKNLMKRNKSFQICTVAINFCDFAIGIYLLCLSLKDFIAGKNYIEEAGEKVPYAFQ